MDTEKKSSPVRYTPQTLPPALLLVGDTAQTKLHAEKILMQTLCPSQGCRTCITCIQILNRQHHSARWLCPERGYTVDSLEDIFSIITFKLGANDHFFFILEKAELLTPATAHKLLKPMEEPPAGYHFILLAQSIDAIMPTIQSRCNIHSFTNSIQALSHPLFACFTTQPATAFELQTIVDKLKINEYETKDLIDAIIHYWIDTYKKKLLTNEQPNQSIQSIITMLLQAQKKLPMPGSSTLFWKNLYLALQQSLYIH